MITTEGKAVITDYGLNEFYKAMVPAMKAKAKNPEEGGSSEVTNLWKLEWTAPEIIETASIVADASEEGDVFSFACVAYEVCRLLISQSVKSINLWCIIKILTGLRPVWRQKKDTGVDPTQANASRSQFSLARMRAVLMGYPPAWHDKRGEMLTDAPVQIREWIEARWDRSPEERGNMKTLVEELDDMIRGFEEHLQQ
jgi:hypothetical protein